MTVCVRLTCVISCLTVMLASSTSAFGQDRWGFGVMAGVTRGVLSNPTVGEGATVPLSPINASAGGIFITRRLNKRLHVESSFSFTSRGTTWQIPDGPSTQATVEVRTLAGDLPLLLHASVGQYGRMRFDLTGGAMFSRMARGDVVEVRTQTVIGRVPLRFASALAVVGGQVRYEQRVPVTLAVRYQYGVTDATDEGSSQHRSVQATLGVQLRAW
jgi:Outer membrane protein beta-barrel domain